MTNASRLACSLLLISSLWAQVQHRSGAAGLETAIQSIASAQTGPAWIGYTVPIVAGQRQMSCWFDGEIQHTPNRPIQLEGATEISILLRLENRTVGKVRVFTPDCQLDPGGLPFYWLDNVRPAESVHYLLSLAKTPASAITAIALHAEPSADAALLSLAAPDQPDSLRRKAIFWLGNSRGRAGYQALDRIVREDPNDKIREHAVFALSQSKEAAAISRVIQVAHEDKSPHVRGQALFWLAQRAGKKVAGTELSHAIENDPEVEVKKKAVFGLSQIPDHEGVPLLIQVARSNRNPEVKKQALFWLGQSKDPRALAFIEEILNR